MVNRSNWLAMSVAVAACGDASGDADSGDESTGPAASTSDADGSTSVATVDSADTSSDTSADGSSGDGPVLPPDELDVIRVQVDWDEENGYTLGPLKHERSGTPTLAARAQSVDPRGSFAGVISETDSGEELYRQTIGIGLSYRYIARGISFRFPAFTEPVTFTLLAETPNQPTFSNVFETIIDPAAVEEVPTIDGIVTMQVHAAEESPALRLNIYSEGYDEESEARFFEDAARVATVLEQDGFPGLGYLEITAVYHPSDEPLPPAVDYGEPIPIPETFLGMLHPYWGDYFERWEQILYPSSEEKFRDALAQVPYDYAMVVADDDQYWGAGNFNAFVAVPGSNEMFAYLVEHETGHFFGLNEEYSTGTTELLFAPGIEPWSQNLTLESELDAIKWASFIDEGVPIPTPLDGWETYGIGAYPGGYGGLDDDSLVPAPEGVCTMSSGPHYCAVCSEAIIEKLEFDLVGAE